MYLDPIPARYRYTIVVRKGGQEGPPPRQQTFNDPPKNVFDPSKKIGDKLEPLPLKNLGPMPKFLENDTEQKIW